MAILTPVQLTTLQRDCERDSLVINYTKAQANAMSQSIEDWFEVNRAALRTAILTAAGGVGFTPTNNQIAIFVKRWLAQKFERGG